MHGIDVPAARFHSPLCIRCNFSFIFPISAFKHAVVNPLLLARTASAFLPAINKTRYIGRTVNMDASNSRWRQKVS